MSIFLGTGVQTFISLFIVVFVKNSFFFFHF